MSRQLRDTLYDRLYGSSLSDRLMMEEIMELLLQDPLDLEQQQCQGEDATIICPTGSTCIGDSCHSCRGRNKHQNSAENESASPVVQQIAQSQAQQLFLTTPMLPLPRINLDDNGQSVVPPLATRSVLPLSNSPSAPILPSLQALAARSEPDPLSSSSLLLLSPVHIMNDAEFDELKRKTRMHEASRRYRKRRKENNRQQKEYLQRLEEELARLKAIDNELPSAPTPSSLSVMQTELSKQTQEHYDCVRDLFEAGKAETEVVTLVQRFIE